MCYIILCETTALHKSKPPFNPLKHNGYNMYRLIEIKPLHFMYTAYEWISHDSQHKQFIFLNTIYQLVLQWKLTFFWET
jgi:hypothetical protein